MLRELAFNSRTGQFEQIKGGGGCIVSVDGVLPDADWNVRLTRYVTQAEFDALEESDQMVQGVRYVVTDAPSSGGGVQAGNLISEDADNTLALGTDNRLFVPPGGVALTQDQLDALELAEW